MSPSLTLIVSFAISSPRGTLSVTTAPWNALPASSSWIISVRFRRGIGVTATAPTSGPSEGRSPSDRRLPDLRVEEGLDVHVLLACPRRHEVLLDRVEDEAVSREVGALEASALEEAPHRLARLGDARGVARRRHEL